jgi:hypothetical protein
MLLLAVQAPGELAVQLAEQRGSIGESKLSAAGCQPLSGKKKDAAA